MKVIRNAVVIGLLAAAPLALAHRGGPGPQGEQAPAAGCPGMQGSQAAMPERHAQMQAMHQGMHQGMGMGHGHMLGYGQAQPQDKEAPKQ